MISVLQNNPTPLKSTRPKRRPAIRTSDGGWSIVMPATSAMARLNASAVAKTAGRHGGKKHVLHRYQYRPGKFALGDERVQDVIAGLRGTGAGYSSVHPRGNG
jgi:hypothetical protein